MHEREHTLLESITVLLAVKYPAKRGTAWPWEQLGHGNSLARGTAWLLTPWSLTLLSLVLLLLHLLTVQVSTDVSKDVSTDSCSYGSVTSPDVTLSG